MSRELILLRHAKTDTASGEDDFNLPLKDTGKREAQLVGSWLLQQEFIPDYVLCSSARHAYVTAEHTCNVMGLGPDLILTDERIYQADKKMLLALLAASPLEAKRILLVGHNSGLEKLLHLLVDKKIQIPKDGKLLPTASLAILKVNKDWSELKPGKASLLSVTRPDNIPKKFPFFNAENIVEWRDRPAYYYSQSGVIPYRVKNGKTEIMIITSSRKKNWIIPKGVIEIGMTPQASAGKEAFEEAGIEGRVGDVLLGTYRHEKWGAECVVAIYPMEVRHIVQENERLEPYRKRAWIPAEEAGSYLKQKELVPMIFSLAEQLMLTGNL